MAGKGSGRRPRAISLKEEKEKWEAIFGKKEKNPDVDDMGNVRYKADPQSGRMIPDYMWAQYDMEDEKPLRGHFIHRDAEDYLSPISGKLISGKRQHRYDLDVHGCRVFEGKESEQRAANSHLEQEDKKMNDLLLDSLGETLNDIKYQNNAPSGEKVSWTFGAD